MLEPQVLSGSPSVRASGSQGTPLMHANMMLCQLSPVAHLGITQYCQHVSNHLQHVSHAVSTSHTTVSSPSHNIDSTSHTAVSTSHTTVSSPSHNIDSTSHAAVRKSHAAVRSLTPPSAHLAKHCEISAIVLILVTC